MKTSSIFSHCTSAVHIRLAGASCTLKHPPRVGRVWTKEVEDVTKGKDCAENRQALALTKRYRMFLPPCLLPRLGQDTQDLQFVKLSISLRSSTF